MPFPKIIIIDPFSPFMQGSLIISFQFTSLFHPLVVFWHQADCDISILSNGKRVACLVLLYPSYNIMSIVASGILSLHRRDDPWPGLLSWDYSLSLGATNLNRQLFYCTSGCSFSEKVTGVFVGSPSKWCSDKRFDSLDYMYPLDV